MPFGSAFAEDQQISNLPARLALRNECGDFAFSSSQPAKRLPGSDTWGTGSSGGTHGLRNEM